MWGLFRRGTPQENAPVRVRRLVVQPQVVYFCPAAGALLGAESLQKTCIEWVRAHVAAPLGNSLPLYVASPAVTIRVSPKGTLPSPPIEMLRGNGAGELEERRFLGATHEALIEAMDPLMTPRPGLWAALAAGRAIAGAVQGIAADPVIPRLLPVRDHGQDLPADGALHVVDHIRVPWSTDEHGLAWVTTLGMYKFGLPDLEVCDVPPNLSHGVGRVLNAVAQLLAERVSDHAQSATEAGFTVRIESSVEVTAAHMDRAHGRKDPASGPGARGSDTVGLRWTGKGRRGLEPLITVVPPPGKKAAMGEWLHSLVSNLVRWGEQEVVRGLSSSPGVQSARARARAELPKVKERFQAGLPPGHTLFVKYGFPFGKWGQEYMWVVVNKWRGAVIQGQLANDPQECKGLRGGQGVEVPEAEVFDWMISRHDGRTEGGYTSQALEGA